MTFDSPQVTVAVALGAGMLCQSLAHHLRVPGIVLLLLAGVLLGPQVAGVVQPDTLGPYLQMIVAVSVAVILFVISLVIALLYQRFALRRVDAVLPGGAHERLKPREMRVTRRFGELRHGDGRRDEQAGEGDQ